MQNLTILGSTGSIGASTLDIVARHPDKYSVLALTAQRQEDALFEQCIRFKPRYAVLLDEAAAARLTQKISAAGLAVQVLCGV
ncbi:MAG: 1-deoxy-D-xylulose-5-phosphate reductoisomerase, partial [Betaproteobacteria bacterium]|nr:1-deoxy-D-xylulose-5-phosphate reductoisomerase [Betaproteobacteria bacterium]